MRSRRHLLVASGTCLLLAIAPAVASAGTTADSLTARMSISTAGVQGNNISGRLSRPDVSADGQIVAFDSLANNLVKKDRNRSVDIFVRDRSTGETTDVSVSSSGKQGNGDSARPSVSADGRYIAFDSTSTNLVEAADNNGSFDVFVHDRVTGTTTLVSQSLSGAAGNSNSFGASISGNGRYVAFNSDATDLSKQSVTGARDIFVRDLLTGRTTVVSVDQNGDSAGVAANAASISANGRYVAFSSFGAGLVSGDSNDAFDVFVRDRKLETTTRISVDTAGVEGNGGSYEPSISNNGSRVAFASDATNLVGDDTNGVRDVFVHDSSTNTTSRVSVGPHGVQGDGQSDGPGIRGGLTFGPDISRNGRWVTFDSIATNLVQGDTNTCELSAGGGGFPNPGQCPDIFIRDLKRNLTTRVSVASDGSQSDGASTDPAISANGKDVVFFTTATDFDQSDTNTCPPFFSVPGTCPDIYLNQR